MESTMIFDLSREGEEIIKNYECTSIRKLFFGQSKGYITLTNRRILYHATGKSIKGKSLVLNEMPINDVSGIGTYMGTSIDWLSMIIFTLVLNYIITPLVFILPGFFNHIIFGLICIIPLLVMNLWERNILSDEVKRKTIDSFQGSTMKDHLKRIPLGLLYSLISILFIYGIYVIAMRLLSGPLKNLRLILFIITYFLFVGNIRVFSLKIYSKSTKGTGIFLPGIQKLQIFNFKTNDTTALDTIAGSPSLDSELLIQEIGAIITDLKEMGDLAISKWK